MRVRAVAGWSHVNQEKRSGVGERMVVRVRRSILVFVLRMRVLKDGKLSYVLVVLENLKVWIFSFCGVSCEVAFLPTKNGRLVWWMSFGSLSEERVNAPICDVTIQEVERCV
jgi:hypothetical protein